MAEQFKEQGGAATMDPKPLRRWLTSKFASYMGSQSRQRKMHEKFDRRRQKAGDPHVLEYFYQLEDGYSHLAAQALPALCRRYDIELRVHLVAGPQGHNSAEPDLLLKLARYDSAQVAPHYGLAFPDGDELPGTDLIRLAGRILANLDSAGFVEHAAAVGQALWLGDSAALESLASQHGTVADAELQRRIAEGTARREALKHYSGAMFYYGGEWYWGVDRLYHLENRLATFGADRTPSEPLLMPRPQCGKVALKDDGRLTLEIYPSLRSPYTAISFDRAVKLAEATGVTLKVRPVLPMVMRGVPATQQKGMYIFMDTAREARAAGVPYGNFADPIGEPVRRAYSLYPWACEQGKGNALLSCFLRCAFAEGINTNTERGLRQVVEQAGLDWSAAKPLVGKSGWETPVEENRQAMYDVGLWGVPSFRLLDEKGDTVLALWGQDRLWLFAREIQRLLKERG